MNDEVRLQSAGKRLLRYARAPSQSTTTVGGIFRIFPNANARYFSTASSAR